MNRSEAKRSRSEIHSDISKITNKKNDNERTIEHQIFYVENPAGKNHGERINLYFLLANKYIKLQLYSFCFISTPSS
jgi:hypothetical protein